jgi:hypothetical protein
MTDYRLPCYGAVKFCWAGTEVLVDLVSLFISDNGCSTSHRRVDTCFIKIHDVMCQEKIISIFTSARTSALTKMLLSLSLFLVVYEFGNDRKSQVVPFFYILSFVTPSSDDDLLGRKM